MLRETVRKLLQRIDPIADARQGRDPEHEYATAGWQLFLQQLGAGGALVPEEYGGLGLSFGDVCAILEETGAACYDGPFLSSAVLATLVLLAADGDVSQDLEALAAGTLTAAVSGVHHGPDPSRWPSEVTATNRDGDWTLTGAASGVIHGMTAQILYVVGRDETGLGVWAVEADVPGHARQSLITLDLSRPQSEHVFSDVPARLVLSSTQGQRRLRAVTALATIALGAEQVGAASQRLAVTLDYARDRYQFGRAIGSFQAIKHRCVDMAVAVEGALASYASARDLVDAKGGVSDCLTEQSADLRRAAAIAGAWCSQAGIAVAAASLQIHGGIGMAWEHDCHIYLRRAKASERLFGNPAQHRAVVLSTI
jgi:alkylation response protein AidB-like acyl-CoA dehydrogenase